MTYTMLSAVYGLGWTEINAMPLAAITVYFERIPNVLALKKTITGEGAILPYTKNWNSILRNWTRSAFGESSAVKATPGMLKMIGIGVKHVKRS